MEFRTGLFSNGVSAGGSLHVPYGSGLGYNSLGGLSIPSVPLWRPTPFQAIPNKFLKALKLHKKFKNNKNL
jgi:hypothetical protein